MDEGHGTGSGTTQSDGGTSGLSNGVAEGLPGGDAEGVPGDDTDGRASDGLATVENWAPPSKRDRTAAVRRFLAPGESLHVVDPVSYLEDGGRPAVVGLTDERVLLVGDDGGFVGVGLDRVCAVRSDDRTALDVRGLDYRLPLLAGYLLAVVGLVGVLGTAGNPLSPTLALMALGGALATDHVVREDADFGPAMAVLRRYGGDTGLADRLRRAGRAVDGRIADDVALLAASTVGVGAFAAIVAVEGGFVTPLYTVLVVVGMGLAVYAFRNSETFGGMELVRRRQRTVTATLEDGTTLTVRTRPESTLARDIARLGQASPPGVGSDGGDTR